MDLSPPPWFSRTFSFDFPVEIAPVILERLRGAPARLAERLLSIEPSARVRRAGGKWSPQEHAGHLLDLEALEIARLEDYAAGRPTLTPADPGNRVTEAARHNERPAEEIVGAFRRERLDFVQRLEALDESALARTALHPRLRQRMRVVDLAFFKAEHDDHHLAAMTFLGRS